MTNPAASPAARRSRTPASSRRSPGPATPASPPGALRGLKKAFVNLGDYSPADAILWMTERQEDEFRKLDLPFNGLFGRPLHAIDCQGLFCELDKYCREAAPELISNRSRIKARYRPSSEPLPLTFPPKWGLTTHAGTIPAGPSIPIPNRSAEQYHLSLDDKPKARSSLSVGSMEGLYGWGI